MDPVTGKWDGFFGKIGYGKATKKSSMIIYTLLIIGEADIGMRGSYFCGADMNRVVDCSPGISYHIHYWSGETGYLDAKL